MTYAFPPSGLAGEGVFNVFCFRYIGYTFGYRKNVGISGLPG